jgi:hypothetical protein
VTEFSLSTTVLSADGDRLYTFEYAALVTETSTTVIEQFVQVGLIESVGTMLHAAKSPELPRSDGCVATWG